MKPPRSGGGWKAIGYSLKLAQRVGWWKMWTAMRSRNTCKTCAVGMGGQLGGMVNEGGYFPEVCKKSFQAMASDMQGGMRNEFIERTSVNQMRAMTPRQLELSGRLTSPLLLERGQTHYKVISWEEAIQRTTAALKAAGPQRAFFYASGRSSNEAGFLLQLLSRLFGTNYVNNCSYYCHQASGVGLGMSIGTGAGTVRLEDLDHTDLVLLIGANPSSNHPRLMRSLMHVRRRGGRIVVVNPMKELGLTKFRVPSDVRSLLFGTEIASTYIQPHIGGDLALLTGIAKEILERNAQDASFIQNHTEGFTEFSVQVQTTAWDAIVQQSGVPREVIRDVTNQYLSAKNAVIAWCMGITHHLHGTNSVQAIVNLALLRGMVGRAHAGLMPIRGHSNVQGLGSVGVTPALKQAMLQRFEQRLGIQLPTSPGYDTMACMQAAHRGEMDTALCLGGNLYGSNPDSRFALEAMERLKTIVYLSTTLNTTHAWGTAAETLILPVLPRDEELQTTTQESMFSYVRLSDGGIRRFDSPRSEVSILAEIGQQIFQASPAGSGSGGSGTDDSNHPVNWKHLQSHAAIRTLMADLVPGYEQIGSFDQGGKEFHVPGRAVTNHQFPTASGKAKFHAVRLPDLSRQPDQLRLMTMRSEGQFNSVVYDEEDLYRGQERRDVLLMNEADMQERGFTADQRVTVRSSAGEMRYIMVRPFNIRAGNVAMYYPESNVLVPHEVDPLSKTPAFKSVLITVEPEVVSVS